MLRRRLLTAASLLVGVGWGAIAPAVEVPPACLQSVVPLNARPPLRDLSGNLPIPDYLDTILGCNGLSQTGPRPPWLAPPSAWMESEKRLYSSVLAKRKVDILVLPFQIQGYGLDRIERALMSADLAYAIGSAGKYAVADPFLVSRALGEGGRRFTIDQVEALAKAVGAKKIVIGYAGHNERHGLFLTIQVRDPLPEPSSAPRQEPWQKDWRAVAFTDERTPFAVFHEMLPEVLAALPLKLSPLPKPSPAPSVAVPTVAGSPLEVVTTSARRVPALALFNLLGALNPSDDELSRERLYEKAVLTSLRHPASDARGRFLEAYALMNLKRRPSALARLSGLQTPSVETLRGLVNGDLPAAKGAMAAVKDPLDGVLLQAAVRDLSYYYQRRPDFEITAAPRLFGQSYGAWEPLVSIRAEQRDSWAVPDAVEIKGLIDAAFPQPGLTLQSLVSGMAIAQGELPENIDIDLAFTRQIRKVVETIDLVPCCSANGPQPSHWDLLWVFEGLNESRIVKAMGREQDLRGLPAEALKTLDRIEPLFSGHPRMSLMRAVNALEMYKKSKDDVRASWREAAHRHASVAAYWAQGQTTFASRALTVMGIPSEDTRFLADAYSQDYPAQPYWHVWFFDAHTNTPRLVRFFVEALAFSCDEVDPVWRLMPLVSPNEYRSIIGELDTRFTANPRRAELWAAAGPANRGGPSDPQAELRAAIKADPEFWDNYYALAMQIIWSGGPYEEASKVFQKYPGFHKTNPKDRVGVSNQANDAGAELYLRGQADLSKPFYKIASDLQTGSDASMNGAIRLQMLSQDYRSAAEGSMRRAMRYSNPHAYKDYFSFLHAFGLSEQAWEGFSQVMANFDLPTVWHSALVGHRRQGLDEPGLRAWVQKPDIRAARFRTRLFAPYYAVLWYSTDRTPPMDLGALVEKIEGPPVGRIDVDEKTVLRPHPLDPNGFEMIEASPFRLGSSPRLAPGTPVKSDLAYFADAYAAVRRRDYKAAVTKFVAMADRYPIEGGTAGIALSYFAYAAAKSGDTAGLEKYVEAMPEHDFDYWMAHAFFAAAREDVATAESALKIGFRLRPPAGYRPVLTEYQYAEACEWLFQDTHDSRFRLMLLDWLRAHQRIQPTHAWAYAMQYTYEPPGDARLRALAFTLFLDAKSERIKGASKADVDRANAWFKDHNPFTVPADEDEETRTTAANL